jgi:hypothetical protein
MGQGDRRSPLAKLALKFGTVATAAAALLAEGNASADESDVLKGLLDRNHAVPADSFEKAVSDGLAPPPLILKPSHAEQNWLLAGHTSHRSHSSHSSHRSHTSGSSHSSHFSSSVGTGSGLAPSARRLDSSPKALDSSTTPPDGPKSSAVASPTVNTPPAPKVKAAPAVDRRDPLLRYQLLTLGTYSGIQKAYVKDLLVGSAKLIKVGETIGDSKLIEILPQAQSIRLKPTTGPELTIKRIASAR